MIWNKRSALRKPHPQPLSSRAREGSSMPQAPSARGNAWLVMFHRHELAVVAVRVEEGRNHAAPVLGAFLADERHTRGFESLALGDNVLGRIDPEVDQRALRLLGHAHRLAMAVDDE